MIWEVRRRSGKVESQLAYDQNRKWTKVKAGSRETDRKQIVHGRNLRRWGLDRRAENSSKPGLQAMLLAFALPLSGVATANLTLQSGQ